MATTKKESKSKASEEPNDPKAFKEEKEQGGKRISREKVEVEYLQPD